MMKLNFDKNNRVQKWDIVLCRRNYEHLGTIHNVSDIKASFSFSSAQEISFTVYKTLDGKEERLWDEIYDLRLIWVKQLNEYYQIEVDLSDSTELNEVKNITATSLCEAELSQTIIHNYEINTETDIENFTILHPADDYIPVLVYRPDNPERSLLNLLLEKTPQYHLEYVAPSIARLQRVWEIDSTSIYDFLVGDFSTELNCHIEFNSATRGISVYDLYNICPNTTDCSYYLNKRYAYRGTEEFCPHCGSRLLYFGNDTTVCVDKGVLSEEIEFTTDVDNIKNVFKLKSGDEYLDAAIAASNINSEYLYYFPEETLHDMTPELRNKIAEYNNAYASRIDEFSQIMKDLYDVLDNIYYYEHSMAPERGKTPMSADTEIQNLTVANLSPTGVDKISTAESSLKYVDSAIVSYAKCYIHSGFFKVEASNSSFNSSTHTWSGTLTVTNYSDEDDTASVTLSINIVGADQNVTTYETFLNQKCEKALAQVSKKEKDDNIFQLLKPAVTYEHFVEYITYFSKARLQSFHDAINSCLEVLIQAGVTNNGTSVDQTRAYEDIYTPYYNKLNAVSVEIETRQDTINGYIDQEVALEAQRDAIQNELNFETYLGEELYNEFSAYRREDTYENQNFISEGLNVINTAVDTVDNAKLFALAQEFLEEANREIIKSAEYQHSISSDLYNLLLIDAFEPIVDTFELGNFIRVRIDDDIYRLRLIKYEIDFNDLSHLSTKFSDMTKTADSVNDVRSILNSAQQMATSYSHVSKQSTAGQEAASTIEEFRQIGLNTALYRINNNDDEEITYDNHGLIAKSYDDITDSYLDEQLKITHNVIAFTDDNWKTLRCALGKFDYTNEQGVKIEGKYGLNADMVVSGFIQGSTIVGGKIYSPHTSRGNATIIDLEGGNLNVGYNQLMYTASTNTLKINGGEIVGGSINLGNGTFVVTNQGVMTATSGTFSGSLNAATGSFSGEITANSGKIGGWNINSTSLYNDGSTVILSGSDGSISGSAISGGSITGTAISGASIIGGSITIKDALEASTSGTKVYGNLYLRAGDRILCRGSSSGYSIVISPEASQTHGIDVTTSGKWSFQYLNVTTYSGLTINDQAVATQKWVEDQEYATGGPFVSTSEGKKGSYTGGSYTKIGDAVASMKNWCDNTAGYVKSISSESNSTKVKYCVRNLSKKNNTITYTVQPIDSSDGRLKYNVNMLEDLSSVYMTLKPVSFKYKSTLKGFDNDIHYGVIAQDIINSYRKNNKSFDNLALVAKVTIGPDEDYFNVEEVIGENSYYVVDKEELHALHIQMIQKQQREIESLQRENQNLQAQINLIMQRISNLEIDAPIS